MWDGFYFVCNAVPRVWVSHGLPNIACDLVYLAGPTGMFADASAVMQHTVSCQPTTLKHGAGLMQRGCWPDALTGSGPYFSNHGVLL